MNFLVALCIFIMNHFVIYDFDKTKNPNDWITVDDVVMGGVSSSGITINKNGNGVFNGHVSIENNGGFSSVRHQFKSIDISDYRCFIIRIKGDGKKYQFRVKSNLNEYHSYKHEFITDGSWQTIEIPFNKLKATFRGRMLNIPSFSNSFLEEIGFLIANKIEEDFELKIDYVKVS